MDKRLILFFVCMGKRVHMDICRSESLTVAETTSCPSTSATLPCPRTFASAVSLIWMTFPESLNISLNIIYIELSLLAFRPQMSFVQ